MATNLERALGALEPVHDELAPDGRMFVRLEGTMSLEAYNELLLAIRMSLDNMIADGEAVVHPPE